MVFVCVHQCELQFCRLHQPTIITTKETTVTKTMTLNHDSYRTRNPLDFMDITPSIPSFMEHSFGQCSIAVREKGHPQYREQWVSTNVHRADHEEGATPLEVDAYLRNNGMYLPDFNEPINSDVAAMWGGNPSMDDGDPHFIDADFDTLVA